MNNQEAIERLEHSKVFNFNGRDSYIEAINIAIEALKHQEQYRWHDLRKNPEDLPGEDDCQDTFYECVHEGQEDESYPAYPVYQYATDLGFGSWENIFDPVTLGFVDSEFITIKEMGLEPIIGWRYIDPFEEGAEE